MHLKLEKCCCVVLPVMKSSRLLEHDQPGPPVSILTPRVTWLRQWSVVEVGGEQLFAWPLVKVSAR